MNYKQHIRDVLDFPKQGVNFKDITTLIQKPDVFQSCIDELALLVQDADVILGLDARGFLFAGALAYKLNKPLIIVRKAGKLPYKTISIDYELEYGTNTFELNIDAIKSGEKVAIIDDLLATGWTAQAACELVKKLGWEISSINCVVGLSFLVGEDLLKDYTVNCLVRY